ncbi:MAG: type IV toxin-antitoxin system AbiEi family antitoxin domain-containing protein [Propionicimonas sp.]
MRGFGGERWRSGWVIHRGVEARRDSGGHADHAIVQRRQDLPRELRQLIGAQQGLVTIEQANLVGVGDKALQRLVAQGHMMRPAKGLYDAAPLLKTFEKRAWAALLLGGPNAAVGGQAALRLQGFELEPDLVEVWVPPETQPVPLPGIRVRRDFLGRVNRRRGRISRIRVEEAVVDVGQFLPTGGLVALLTEGFRGHITTPAAVSAEIGKRARVRDRKRFEAILGDLAGVESALEFAYRRDVERAHRLPPPRRQFSVSKGTRSDGFYEQFGVIIELDGRGGHERVPSVFRDLERDNAHATHNLLTLRYGSADVRGKPCEVAAQVATALRSRGWTGDYTGCPRCRASLSSRKL